LVAHSKTVPVPQPVADMVPVVDGQTLSEIVIVGAVGNIFTVTSLDSDAVHPLVLVTVTV
jgi:hypothetical protein